MSEWIQLTDIYHDTPVSVAVDKIVLIEPRVRQLPHGYESYHLLVSERGDRPRELR